ncbi:MAG: hypothetical protein CMM28_05445 [Rhodospirillaceae bacterium]|nr:hypothetical protein [Rhodospirillaceae bacterium]
MSAKVHIVADISANGFGHLAQISPILMALAKVRPGLKVTLRTEVDPVICGQFLDIPFKVGPTPPDPNMRMKGPLDVDADGLFEDYQNLVADWENVITSDAAVLAALKPDLVLTNIAVASVAAALRARIPVAAICSLNWADVFAAYCGTDGEARQIYDHLTNAYAAVDRFIQLQPHMPMDWVPSVHSVGPVARIGKDRRGDLQAARPADHYVLATMGGIPGMHTQVPLPEVDGVMWVVPPEWESTRTDILSRKDLDIAFIDLMRSCDALVTKAGYGGVTESAVNSTRILYTERTNWCETSILETWIAKNCTGRHIERDVMQSGDFGAVLQDLLAVPITKQPVRSGVDDAVAVLMQLL